MKQTGAEEAVAQTREKAEAEGRQFIEECRRLKEGGKLAACRKLTLAKYEEVIGPVPEKADWRRLHLEVAYTLFVRGYEREGALHLLPEKMRERYEAIRRGDWKALGQVLELTELTFKKPTTSTPDSAPSKKVKGKKTEGKTLGLKVNETWAYLFRENEKLAATGGKPKTDKEIVEFMKEEFGRCPDSWKKVAHYRYAYNSGRLTKGTVPEIKSRKWG